MKNSSKIIIIGSFILLGITSLLPNFHPEHLITKEYNSTLDIAIHASLYLVISLIVFSLKKHSKLKYQTITALSIFLFSFIIEFSQKFIPGRTFTFQDLGSNILGISIGWSLIFILSKQ